MVDGYGCHSCHALQCLQGKCLALISFRAELNTHGSALTIMPSPHAWSHHLAFPRKYLGHQEKQINGPQ